MKSAHERAAYLRQTSSSRSSSAAGSSEIKKPAVLEKRQKVKGACAGVAMKACRIRQQLT
jgi:hypothetical protein